MTALWPTTVDQWKARARTSLGADGLTIVLRDGDQCFYADEDAVAPLWKGQRFPLVECISGWAMLQGEPAFVPDIEVDERIPIAAYRPTFVRSLAMVPVGAPPIGAIGAYWARQHEVTADETEILQRLAAEALPIVLELLEDAPWAPNFRSPVERRLS